MKTSLSTAPILALLLAAAPAGAQTMAPQTPTTQAHDAATTGPMGTPLSGFDRNFAQKATIGGMAEVEDGELAANQAQSADVQAFGKQMVADHKAAGDKLKAILDQKNVQVPTELDAMHKHQNAALQKLNGAAFDRQYVREQLQAHKTTVALFEKESSKGSDPELKQFATDTLPTLKDHLSHIEALAAKSS